MKYNNEILNKIVETYGTEYHSNLGLENITNRYLEMMKNGSKIHIKKKNRGKFNASAKAAGQSVQEHARSVMNNPKATPLQKRRAQFAINAKKFKH